MQHVIMALLIGEFNRSLRCRCQFVAATLIAGILPLSALADMSTGSGCAISDEYVLTASHVVDDAEKIMVSFGGTAMRAEVFRKNTVEDWAVLRLDGRAPSHVSCSREDVKLGERIYTLGFPSTSLLGEEIKHAEGTVSSLAGIQGDRTRFQISAPIQPGNSGGPLFNSKGCLVGIVQSTIDPEVFYKCTQGALPQNINFAYRTSGLVDDVKHLFSYGDGTVSIDENRLATCLIKVALRERPHTDNPIVIKRALPVQQERKHEVSPRFTQLSSYLTGIANGEFFTPDGSKADACSDDGFKCIERDILLSYEYMCMELDRSAAISSDNRKEIRLRAKILVRSARDRISKAYNDQKMVSVARAMMSADGAKSDIEGMPFFGLQLGDKITCGNKWPEGKHTVMLNGYESSRYMILDPSYSRVFPNDDTPSDKLCRTKRIRGCTLLEYKIQLSKPVLGVDIIQVYTLRDGRIVGMKYDASDPKREKDSTAIAVSAFLRSYEKKLGLRFSTNDGDTALLAELVTKYEITDLERYSSLDLYPQKCFRHGYFQTVAAFSWSVNIWLDSYLSVFDNKAKRFELLILDKDIYRLAQADEKTSREAKTNNLFGDDGQSIDGL